PDVISGMRTRSRLGLTAGPADLVRFFAELDPPSFTSIEIYDVAGDLVAWNGLDMPIQAGPNGEVPIGRFLVGIASDRGVRDALVVWWPVRDGGRVLGAVRAMQMIAYDAPVRNKYLRDLSLREDWTRLTGLPVHVSFEASASRPARSLTSLAGSSLAGSS